MEAFLARYGLLAVFVGMWVEGETVLLVSGFLAHQRLISLWALLPVAFLGAFSVDNAFYAAGRFLSSHPRVRRFLERPALQRLHRHGESWGAFLLVRFLYGTRAPFMVYLGSRPLPYARFVLREVPALLLWSALWIFFGHALGRALVVLLGELHSSHRTAVVAILALAGLLVMLILAAGTRVRSRRAAALGTP
ncbi:MAG: DedA family protein [Acidobacteriota bacterium]